LLTALADMDQSLKFVVSKISAKANSILTLSPQAKAWGYSNE
jgi:hypothetical protein